MRVADARDLGFDPQLIHMDRQRVLAASHEEARLLAGQPVSEVTPSRRDFALYVATQKQGLAVIARIAPTETVPGPAWGAAELVQHARACDDADVAALAVVTAARALPLTLLVEIAEATTAPILRDDLLVSPSQLYAARLYGADAAVFPAVELDRTSLAELVTVASSLHMASVIEVSTPGELEIAISLPHVIVGLRCLHADDTLDVDSTLQLARQVPQRWTIIALPEVRSRAAAARLSGVCDAIMIGDALVGSDDISATLREITAPAC